MPQGNATVRDIITSYNNGELASVANLIYVSNTMIADAPAVEANNFDVHKDVQIVQLPESSRRRYNEGIKASKPVRNKIIVPIGISEAHMNIDQDLFDIQPNKEAWLAQNGETYVQSITIDTGNYLIYADEQVDEQVGIANIFSSMSDEFISKQIINAAGVEANGITSIWLISWHSNGAYLAYPRGSRAGVKIETFASDKLYDSSGGTYKGRSVRYQMRLAPVVKNTRNFVRVANIPTNDIANLRVINLFQAAYLRMKDNGVLGNKVFYVNESIFNALFNEINDKTRALVLEYVNGEPVFKFWGIAIKKNDQITNAESQVS
jgi:hypothetical protein